MIRIISLLFLIIVTQFGFTQNHQAEFKSYFRTNDTINLVKVLLEWEKSNPSIPYLKIVDGELFSWYGSRLIHAANYFRKLKESLFLNDEFTV